MLLLLLLLLLSRLLRWLPLWLLLRPSWWLLLQLLLYVRGVDRACCIVEMWDVRTSIGGKATRVVGFQKTVMQYMYEDAKVPGVDQRDVHGVRHRADKPEVDSLRVLFDSVAHANGSKSAVRRVCPTRMIPY